MTDVRWIGREGEKLFSLLCSRRMVSCNKAEEDDRGWDFIISFPAPATVRVPLDQRSVGATALVQIKATRVDARRWSISLKNALSLGKSSLPAFIVCVGLDAEGKETFRAIHLWRTEISRILMAARQAHVEGDEATNRRTISFEFGEETARADLLSWMAGEIEEIGEARYAAEKQLLVDTLGFEGGRGVARIRFSTDALGAFEDLQLGLIKSLGMDQFTYTPSRFGIEDAVPEIQVEGATLQIVPLGRSGTLRLRAPGGEHEHLPAEVFSAVIPGRRRVKARVKAGCIDVVIKSKGRITVKSRLSRDEKTTLDNIGAFALLKLANRTAPLTVSLKTTASFADFGYINTKGEAEPGWQQLFFITKALRKLAAFEDVQPPLTTIDAIDAQFVPLSVLDALVAERALRIDFTPIEERAGIIGALLAYTSVSFGGIAIGAVASRPVVADVMIGSRRQIDFGPATILHASMDDGCAGEVHDRYMDELDRMSETMDVMAVGDLHRSVENDEDRVLVIDESRCRPQRRFAFADG